jgi:hypothetical protein
LSRENSGSPGFTLLERQGLLTLYDRTGYKYATTIGGRDIDPIMEGEMNGDDFEDDDEDEDTEDDEFDDEEEEWDDKDDEEGDEE